MIGLGTKLQIESATPGTFTDIAGLDTINPSMGELGMIDGTNHGSVDSAEEMIPGLLKWGEVAFEGNYSGDASQVSCITALQGRTLKNFKVVFPTAVPISADTLAFSGYVTKFAITAPAKDKLRFSGTITVTTKPTLA